MINKLDRLLGTVGLLRAKFSQIMSAIHENREGYKARYATPPQELIVLMAKTQELFAELLKSSESLLACKEKMELLKSDADLDDTIGNQAMEQALERLRVIDTFLIELETTRFPYLNFDPGIWQEGRVLIQETLETSK